MQEETHVPAFNQPMYGAQMLIPLQCKECHWRDKRKVVLEGKEQEIGYTKAVCSVFPDSKPNGIMKNKEKCPFFKG